MAEQHEIKIEKSIPVPAKKRGCLSSAIFKDMKIGDSALIPRGNYVSLESCRTSVFSGARRCCPDMKFTTRSDREAGGVRIWRVA